MKLLGNSGYGNTITNVDRHHDVKYCTEAAASIFVNDRRFRQLDVVVDDAYEIEMNKKTVTYALPVHEGFFVLLYAKLCMLQFYYDFFMNRYLESPLFQYCEMETYSAYLVLASESVDDLVTRELREHYFRHRSEWLSSESCAEHQNEYVRCRLAGRSWACAEPCCYASHALAEETPRRMVVGTGRLCPTQTGKTSFQETRIFVGGRLRQLQADLVDLSNLKNDKDGTTFFLTVIDVFTKVTWCVPLKNKSAASLVTALKSTFIKGWPKTLQTDKGLEFLNRSVQALLKKYSIHHFSNHNEETKASIVERFNQMLKTRLWRYFTKHQTWQYRTLCSRTTSPPPPL